MKKIIILLALFGIIHPPVYAQQLDTIALDEVPLNSIVLNTINIDKVNQEKIILNSETIRQVEDIGFLIASPFVYRGHNDKLQHYLIVNGLIKGAKLMPICKKHPVITAITVFVGFSIGKELIYDKGFRGGKASWKDVTYGNLPATLVNIDLIKLVKDLNAKIKK